MPGGRGGGPCAVEEAPAPPRGDCDDFKKIMGLEVAARGNRGGAWEEVVWGVAKYESQSVMLSKACSVAASVVGWPEPDGTRPAANSVGRPGFAEAAFSAVAQPGAEVGGLAGGASRARLGDEIGPEGSGRFLLLLVRSICSSSVLAREMMSGSRGSEVWGGDAGGRCVRFRTAVAEATGTAGFSRWQLGPGTDFPGAAAGRVGLALK